MQTKTKGMSDVYGVLGLKSRSVDYVIIGYAGVSCSVFGEKIKRDTILNIYITDALIHRAVFSMKLIKSLFILAHFFTSAAILLYIELKKKKSSSTVVGKVQLLHTVDKMIYFIFLFVCLFLYIKGHYHRHHLIISMHIMQPCL